MRDKNSQLPQTDDGVNDQIPRARRPKGLFERKFRFQFDPAFIAVCHVVVGMNQGAGIGGGG